jgi:hypothetical protein
MTDILEYMDDILEYAGCVSRAAKAVRPVSHALVLPPIAALDWGLFILDNTPHY